MKKPVAVLSAMALAMSLTTPALAGTTYNGQAPTQQQLTDSCWMVPNHMSGFTYEGVFEGVNPSVEDHTTTDPVQYTGTDVYGGLEFTDLHVNPGVGGGDLNIFADTVYTTVTHPAGTQTIHHNTTTTNTQVFGCKVYKYTGPGGKNLVMPPDQQIHGLLYSATWSVTVTSEEIVQVPSQTVPLTEPVLAESDVLVCHPQGRDSVWTLKNGYTGDCSYNAYLAAGGTN